MSEKNAKQERKELTELEKAKKLLQKDQEERSKKCIAEVQQVIDKWGFTFQAAATKEVMQGFMNLVSNCNVNMVPKQQDNGDKRK